MPARLLVIEPDPLQQIGIRSALAAAGYSLGSAADATAARRLLHEQDFELVLIGPGQPAEEGSAIAAAIRDASGKSPPVVALATLPDVVIGHEIPGTGAKLPPFLPAVLEALTRYQRFAPTRAPRSPAELERLVGDWAEYDRRTGSGDVT